MFMKKNKNFTINNYSEKEKEFFIEQINASMQQGFLPKDKKVSDKIPIIDISIDSERGQIICNNNSGIIILSLKENYKFFKKYGFEFKNFEEDSKKLEEYVKNNNICKDLSLIVTKVKPQIEYSFDSNKINLSKELLLQEIKNPTRTFRGKIISKNGGGYMVQIGDFVGFLPGSLAATNIVRDWQSLIGKELELLVDDYLASSNMFVFSFKKYVNWILPQKIKNFDFNKCYKGIVTGTSKLGIFVEFEEIFTGLIHTTKMSQKLLEEFELGNIKSGDEINIYVIEFNGTKPILTDIDIEYLKDDFYKKTQEIISSGPIEISTNLLKLENNIFTYLYEQHKYKNIILKIKVTQKINKKSLKIEPIYWSEKEFGIICEIC